MGDTPTNCRADIFVEEHQLKHLLELESTTRV